MTKVQNFWFQKTRLCCRPSSWQGWLVTAIYLLGIIADFIKADSSSHSAGDTLIRFAPRFIIASLLYWFICRRTSQRVY